MALTDPAGRTAVVTGAASGIGLAIATRLVRRGADVVLADVEAPALAEAVAGLRDGPGRVLGVTTDVSDATSVDRLATRVDEAFGPVHLLVNNAGVGLKGRPWELALADWEWVLGVGLWGLVHGIRSFLPGMIGHGQDAHVVTTSSMMGLGTAASGAPYQATKHAVTAISESLAHDLAETAPQVGVSVLVPAHTTTRIREGRRNRPARLGGPAAVPAPVAPRSDVDHASPDDVADALLAGLRDKRFYITLDWERWRPLVARRFEAILEGRLPQEVRLGG